MIKDNKQFAIIIREKIYYAPSPIISEEGNTWTNIEDKYLECGYKKLKYSENLELDKPWEKTEREIIIKRTNVNISSFEDSPLFRLLDARKNALEMLDTTQKTVIKKYAEEKQNFNNEKINNHFLLQHFFDEYCEFARKKIGEDYISKIVQKMENGWIDLFEFMRLEEFCRERSYSYKDMMNPTGEKHNELSPVALCSKLWMLDEIQKCIQKNVIYVMAYNYAFSVIESYMIDIISCVLNNKNVESNWFSTNRDILKSEGFPTSQFDSLSIIEERRNALVHHRGIYTRKKNSIFKLGEDITPDYQIVIRDIDVIKSTVEEIHTHAKKVLGVT
jgi:Mg2+ and Co2+ transporter CorA